MENQTDNRSIKKPSHWDKFLAGVCGGVLAGIMTQGLIMMVELFSIASRRISKRPINKDLHNKFNDMMHDVAVPATIVGAAIGWDIPEREYLKRKDSLLHTENAELKGRLYADSMNPKSWVELEQVKTESAQKVEQNR